MTQRKSSAGWRRRRVLLAALVSLGVSGVRLAHGQTGSGQAPPAAPPPVAQRPWATKLDQPGLKNFHRVTPMLFRGAQPTAEGMRSLESMGVKTIVNLRGFNSDRKEVKGTRLKLEEISVRAWHPDDQDVIRFLRLVANTNNLPVFVHCQHGADRTGTMVAIYRIALQGWSKEEAIAEMTQGDFGFHAVWKNLIRYVRNLDVAKIKRRAGFRETTQP
jgi:protein tyrosine/serine phosphatase